MKYLILSVLSIFLIKIIFFTKYTNNVCKTFEDYYNDRDNNENCYYNPDQHLLVPEIITRHGYPLEVYNVTTIDGYVLTLFRIPHQKNAQKIVMGKPIFLQHGFGTNCACFLSLGEKSLGFILANEGYDVWMGNSRGTKYSSNHTNLSASDNEYWNFTQHELGIYDLDAQIEFVWRKTNQKMVYLGYSMGTMSIYIYISIHPAIVSDKVSFLINMAPSVFLSPGESYLRIGMPLLPYLMKLTFFNRVSLYDLVKHACYPHIFQLKICLFFLQLLYGFNSKQHDPETLPVSFIQQADNLPIKLFDHMMQIILSGKFQQYDYGVSVNKKMYGSAYPPQYTLSDVKIPAHFIRAKNDLMMTKEGAEKLYQALPYDATPYDIHVINNEDFSHLDFVMGKDAVPLVYDHIVQFLRIQSTL